MDFNFFEDTTASIPMFPPVKAKSRSPSRKSLGKSPARAPLGEVSLNSKSPSAAKPAPSPAGTPLAKPTPPRAPAERRCSTGGTKRAATLPQGFERHVRAAVPEAFGETAGFGGNSDFTFGFVDMDPLNDLSDEEAPPSSSRSSSAGSPSPQPQRRTSSGRRASGAGSSHRANGAGSSYAGSSHRKNGTGSSHRASGAGSSYAGSLHRTSFASAASFHESPGGVFQVPKSVAKQLDTEIKELRRRSSVASRQSVVALLPLNVVMQGLGESRPSLASEARRRAARRRARVRQAERSKRAAADLAEQHARADGMLRRIRAAPKPRAPTLKHKGRLVHRSGQLSHALRQSRRRMQKEAPDNGGQSFDTNTIVNDALETNTVTFYTNPPVELRPATAQRIRDARRRAKAREAARVEIANAVQKHARKFRQRARDREEARKVEDNAPIEGWRKRTGLLKRISLTVRSRRLSGISASECAEHVVASTSFYPRRAELPAEEGLLEEDPQDEEWLEEPQEEEPTCDRRRAHGLLPKGSIAWAPRSTRLGPLANVPAATRVRLRAARARALYRHEGRKAAVPEPAAEEDVITEEAPAEEAAVEELPITLENTMKEMQSFAKEHPELGEIKGTTKPVFLENLKCAWAQRGATAEAAEEPLVDEAPEFPDEEAAAEELPITLENTMKEMQSFAKEHPELGEIEGKTKPVFLKNLQFAWVQRGTTAGEPPAPLLTRATLPVSTASTMKDLQKYAKTFQLQIGDVEGKTKAVFFENLCSALEKHGILA